MSAPEPGRLPDFLIIGAPRCGTTALHRFLDQHPRLVMSDPKEPHHLCFAGDALGFAGPGDERLRREWLSDEADYRALFAGIDPHRRAGEASTTYLWCRGAPARAGELLGPGVRMIALLRDPAERAWSTFHYLRREGFEPCEDLRDALAREEERARAGWAPMWRYVELGRYAEQLERWLAVFPREQLLVLRQDDLEAEPERVLREVFAFLGVEGHRPEVDVRVNPSGTIRSPLVHRALTGDHALKRLAKRYAPWRVRNLAARIGAANVQRAGGMDAELRAEVVARVADDVRALEALLGWDLAAWRSAAPIR
jgi:hypothetical protein